MAAYNKFNIFVYDLGRGYHNLDAAGHVLKVKLVTTAAAPVATDAVSADVTPEITGTGYAPIDIQNTWTQGTTITTLSTAASFDPVWTATASDWQAFQYVVLYNDSQSTPVKPLVAWWDYGSALTLASGETFTVDFSTSVFTLT